MKTRIIIFSLLFFTCCLLSAQTGLIRELSGTVEIKNGASFVPANVGDQVREDTVISTGFKSTALVEIGSTNLVVRPLTRLTLTEIRATAGTETLNVNLHAGRVRVDINPPAGSRAAMAVTSPSATASVRGTSFEFDTRNLYVQSGNVIFKGTRSLGTPIRAGSSSTVGTAGIAINPVEFGPIVVLRPQLPPGTQANASPVSITVSDSNTPGPDQPSNQPWQPSDDSGYGDPGNNDADANIGVGWS